LIAEQLIDATCDAHDIDRDQLDLHSDNGPSMTSKKVAQLLADLGVIRSLSRPHVSNDHPFSESQFKTLKNSLRFPTRFTSLAHARTFTDSFFEHYNNHHHRFRKRPTAPKTPDITWINEPEQELSHTLWQAPDR
jgi:putative transposase